ncbi:MAG: hypothetical protein OXH96_24075 [Spirochaetaceae bacterium]|nr:hypothetical protein [Spirochaetaceae bacterium]
MCDYHADHTEDDAPCLKCARLHVAVGDRVRDPLDGTRLEIIRVTKDLGLTVLVDTGDEHPELRDAPPASASIRASIRARAFGAAANALLGQAAAPHKLPAGHRE